MCDCVGARVFALATNACDLSDVCVRLWLCSSFSEATQPYVARLAAALLCTETLGRFGDLGQVQLKAASLLLRDMLGHPSCIPSRQPPGGCTRSVAHVAGGDPAAAFVRTMRSERGADPGVGVGASAQGFLRYHTALRPPDGCLPAQADGSVDVPSALATRLQRRQSLQSLGVAPDDPTTPPRPRRRPSQLERRHSSTRVSSDVGPASPSTAVRLRHGGDGAFLAATHEAAAVGEVPVMGSARSLVPSLPRPPSTRGAGALALAPPSPPDRRMHGHGRPGSLNLMVIPLTFNPRPTPAAAFLGTFRIPQGRVPLLGHAPTLRLYRTFKQRPRGGVGGAAARARRHSVAAADLAAAATGIADSRAAEHCVAVHASTSAGAGAGAGAGSGGAQGGGATGREASVLPPVHTPAAPIVTVTADVARLARRLPVQCAAAFWRARGRADSFPPARVAGAPTEVPEVDDDGFSSDWSMDDEAEGSVRYDTDTVPVDTLDGATEAQTQLACVRGVWDNLAMRARASLFTVRSHRGKRPSSKRSREDKTHWRSDSSVTACWLCAGEWLGGQCCVLRFGWGTLTLTVCAARDAAQSSSPPSAGATIGMCPCSVAQWMAGSGAHPCFWMDACCQPTLRRGVLCAVCSSSQGEAEAGVPGVQGPGSRAIVPHASNIVTWLCWLASTTALLP